MRGCAVGWFGVNVGIKQAGLAIPRYATGRHYLAQLHMRDRANSYLCTQGTNFSPVSSDGLSKVCSNATRYHFMLLHVSANLASCEAKEFSFSSPGVVSIVWTVVIIVDS